MLLTSNISRSATSIFKSKDLTDDYTSYVKDDLQLVLKCTLILGSFGGRGESVAYYPACSNCSDSRCILC